MRISFRRALPVLAGALCLAAALALFALRQGAPKAAVPGSALRSGAAGEQVLRPLGPEGSTYAFAFSAAENSLYHTVNALQGQGSLVAQLDFSALQEHVLCSVPGCAHNSGACPAYCSGYGTAYALGDAVYSVSSSREADGSIRSSWYTLREHALDGSAVREVAQVNFLEWGAPFAACGTRLYRAYAGELRMIDLANGQETILSRSFSPQPEAILASCEDVGQLPDGRLVLIFCTPQERIFCAMDARGRLEELCRLPGQAVGMGCFAQSDYYYSDAGTGSLYALNTLTGEVRHFSDALCALVAPGGYGVSQLRTVDGRLTVMLHGSEEASAGLRLFAFPLSGGQPAEITLTDFFNGYLHPLQVRLETPAGLLVVGDRPYAGTALIQGQDGGSYAQDVYTEHLALISPEDYFASNPNFHFFDQLPQPLPG